MKYLLLLFLVSCASQPNCTSIEKGKILNSTFEILECSRVPICSDNDTECVRKTTCVGLNRNNKYSCVQRD